MGEPADFSTPRLTVTHWRQVLRRPSERAPLETALTGLLTPAVLSHLPPALHLTDVTDWIADRAAESDVYLIRKRLDQGLIGLLILANPAPETAPEDWHLGYLLAEAAWGQGYASEVLGGLLEHHPRPARLIGGVEAANPASARVLEKHGFTRDPDLSGPDHAIYVRVLD